VARSRKRAPAPDPGRGRRLAIVLSAASLAASVGVVWWLRNRPAREDRPVSHADQDAVDVARKFLNHWSRFEYGEAILVSTGDARSRVLLAMEKELSLDPREQETAAALRAEVEDVTLELRVRQVQDEGPGRKTLHVTAYAHEGGDVFERDQTFHLEQEQGAWKVARWDTGTRPGDKRR
jgi:hypothetical protein